MELLEQSTFEYRPFKFITYNLKQCYQLRFQSDTNIYPSTSFLAYFLLKKRMQPYEVFWGFAVLYVKVLYTAVIIVMVNETRGGSGLISRRLRE